MEKVTEMCPLASYTQYYLTKSMDPWETNGHTISEEIPCLLWSLKVHIHLRPCITFHNMLHSFSRLENKSLLAVHDSLFSIFAATTLFMDTVFHPQPEDAPCCGVRRPT
jgi:hypothetical protein